MEDGTYTRRSTPTVCETFKQGLPWPAADLHYKSSTSNFVIGRGTNSFSGGVQRMEETSESGHEQRAHVQNLARGPEHGRPQVQKASPVSSNVVVNHSSGAQRALQGRWTSPQALADVTDSSQLADVDTERILSTGLSEGLDLSEVSALASHRCTGASLEYFWGESSISGNGTSNLYPGQISAQEIGIVDSTEGTGYEQDAVKGAGTSRSSSSLSLSGRPTRPGRNWARHAPRNAVVEESIGEFFVRAPVTNALPMNRQGRGGRMHLNGTVGNFNCLSNPLTVSRNSSHGTLLDGETCRGDSQLFLSSAVVDRVPDKETPTLNGSSSRSLASNPRSTNKHERGSSRASACKRKSCPSSLSVSFSGRSGSPHCSGVQESHGTRFTGGCSTGRRSSGTMGCMSASDVVASASALVPRSCSETSVAGSGGDELRSRKSPLAWDGDSPGSRRAAKSPSEEIVGGAFGLRDVKTVGIGEHMVQQTSSLTQPPFTLSVQRANPAIERVTWCSENDCISDCLSNTAFVSENSEMLKQSTDQLMASTGGRRSGSQLVSSSRNEGTASGRRSDHISSLFGEIISPRYTITSSRNMMTSGSAVGLATDSRLRVRGHINSSAELSNSFGSSHSRNLVSTQGVLHSGIASRPLPSRLPPQTPVARTTQSLSSVHLSMLSSPNSGLTSSRMLPSPPIARSSFLSAVEVLPSGSSIFQGSVLPRHNERGGTSDAERMAGFPFRGLQLSDGENQPRLVAEGLAEILLALDQVERDEDLTYEQLLMLEATLLFGGMGLHDQHSDLRLDVDNMSYEELLALEERIGNVNTGLTLDVVNKHLRKGTYSAQAVRSAGSLESDINCSICQEEYEADDELGKIDCGHSYHISCIRQWLMQKNVCPICKASALSS